MGPFLLALLGFACGATLVFFVFEPRRKRVDELDRKLRRLGEELEDRDERLSTEEERLRRERTSFDFLRNQLQAERLEFDRRIIKYDELARENFILKMDLRNLAVAAAKRDYEHRELSGRQTKIQEMADALGSQFLSETQKWVARSLTTSNYTSNKNRLIEAIARCRAIGVNVDRKREQELLANLQSDFELAVRAEVQREEQARIRERMREDLLREKELQKAREAAEQAEREQRAIEEALAKALALAAGQHSEEVSRLKAQLAEAELKSQRTKSLAEQTKVGHIYVISNIGSFGKGVFKIGMTRREDPKERVFELGDASVPFPFDVHMMIKTDNAPNLEKVLHRAFYKSQLNKTNPRKEFFRTSIEEITRVVEENRGIIEFSVVEYSADAKASQYYDSLNMSAEDQKFIEEVYERVDATLPE